MDILLLGPVELGVNGHLIELKSDKVRRLMVALALEPGKAVTADRLMSCLWDDDGVRDRARLHEYVSRARRQLREAAGTATRQPRTSQGPDLDRPTEDQLVGTCPDIRQRAHTYTLETSPAAVDIYRFRRLCEDARTAAARGEDEPAVELLDAARKIWRGEPLAGLPGLWPAQVRMQLEAEHTSATAARSAASLRLGRFESLVGELTDQVQRDPVDEQFAGYLMLACYGSRRHSDALRVYQGLRRALRADSGNEPDVGVGRIYQGMVEARPVESLVREFARGGGAHPVAVAGPLSTPGAALPHGGGGGIARAELDTEQTVSAESHGDSGAAPVGSSEVARQPQSSTALGSAAVPMAMAVGTLPGAPPPRMLPRQAALEGRQAELRQILDGIETGVDPGVTSRLVTITGMPGVGKTALAVHAAQRIARTFPDGELYVNLRGHDGHQAPLRPETALGILLRGLGVNPESVPAGSEECASMLRTMLSSRRCVIVLDDAESADQVAPLLPNESASVIIITSRRYLANLPDAYPVSLKALPAHDAIALFRRLGGTDRSRDTEEVERITRLVGYLPLAIRLVAMRFHGRQTWTLHTLSKRLERGRRLSELRDMETQEGIDLAFSMSYRTLGPAERRAFRLMSLHPGEGFSTEAAAAILDVPLQRAESMLENLLSGSLILEIAPNRHKYHDLLAEYAFSLAQSEESETERNGAVARLTMFFIQIADQADRLAYPHRLAPAVQQDVPSGALSLPFESTPTEARAWFETEREALLAIEVYSSTHEAAHQAAQLGQHMSAFLEAEWHSAELKEIAVRSAQYWRQADNQAALSRSMLSLSAAHTQIGEYRAAVTCVAEALSIAHGIGDLDAEAQALRARGILQWYMGGHRSALKSYEAALSLKTATEDTLKYRLYGLIGVAHLYLGEHDQARENLRAAIHGLRSVGDALTLARGLINEGNLRMRTRDPYLARESFEEARAIFESMGNVHDLAMVHVNLADSLRAIGKAGVALPVYRKWLTVFQSLQDKRGEADTLNGLGFSYGQTGQHMEALRCHGQALVIAREIGAVREETIAERGLGTAQLALGGIDSAISHFLSAMEIADRMDDPDEGAAACELLAEAQLADGQYLEAVALLRRLAGKLRSRRPREAHRLSLQVENIESLIS